MKNSFMRQKFSKNQRYLYKIKNKIANIQNCFKFELVLNKNKL
jgi:hypothetical protein